MDQGHSVPSDHMGPMFVHTPTQIWLIWLDFFKKLEKYKRISQVGDGARTTP